MCITGSYKDPKKQSTGSMMTVESKDCEIVDGYDNVCYVVSEKVENVVVRSSHVKV